MGAVVTVLNRMVRKGYGEKVVFELRPAGGEGREPGELREVFQAEGQRLGSAQPP